MTVNMNSKFKFLILIVCLLNFFSCRGGPASTTTDSSTSPTDGSSEDTAVDNSAGFKVSVETTSAYSYTVHKGDGSITDDFAEDCVIDDNSPSTNITCIVEAKELDLFFHGVKLKVNVPQNLCEYVEISRPYYYNFLPGTGPTMVIDNRSNPASIDMTTYVVPAGELYVGDESQASVYCKYNYGSTANVGNYMENGPNCCVGDYEYRVYSSLGVMTSSSGKWGGKYANCVSGPAMQVDGFGGFYSNGYPKSTIYNVLTTGLSTSYKVSSPLSLGLSSNIYAANYFNPAQHTSSTHTEYGNVPVCTAAINGAQEANPYHLFKCYDRAGETLASIKVMVRDWNLDSEYELGASGDSDAGFNNALDLFDLGDVATTSGSGDTTTSLPKEIKD